MISYFGFNFDRKSTYTLLRSGSFSEERPETPSAQLSRQVNGLMSDFGSSVNESDENVETDKSHEIQKTSNESETEKEPEALQRQGIKRKSTRKKKPLDFGKPYEVIKPSSNYRKAKRDKLKTSFDTSIDKIENAIARYGFKLLQFLATSILITFDFVFTKKFQW